MTDNKSEDAKDDGGKVILTPPSFRINAKQFFLTYPQCDMTKDAMYDALMKLDNAEKIVIGREKHEDGNYHLHVYIKYFTKKNIKSATHFDINGYHPNIQSAKSEKAVIGYITKDRDILIKQAFDMTNTNNYSKRKTDFSAWEQDMMIAEREDLQYPITFLGQEIQKPDPKNKRRHLWIVGEPSIGKTYAINETFGGKKVFLRSKDKYPYENYNNEDIIIYDDVSDIKFEELSNVTETWKLIASVGDSRYTKKFWKLNHTRTVIVISNTEPDYHHLHNAFLSRFKVINLATRHHDED